MRITEEAISTIVGGMVVLIVATLLFNYFKKINEGTFEATEDTRKVEGIGAEGVCPGGIESIEYYESDKVKKVVCNSF